MSSADTTAVRTAATQIPVAPIKEPRRGRRTGAGNQGATMFDTFDVDSYSDFLGEDPEEGVIMPSPTCSHSGCTKKVTAHSPHKADGRCKAHPLSLVVPSPAPVSRLVAPDDLAHVPDAELLELYAGMRAELQRRVNAKSAIEQALRGAA